MKVLTEVSASVAAEREPDLVDGFSRPCGVIMQPWTA